MSVEHQTDIRKLRYPRGAPGDYGEVFDYVARKGPISYDEICSNTPFMSPDEIFDALEWCLQTGHLEKGEMKGKHGIVRTQVYFAPVSFHDADNEEESD